MLVKTLNEIEQMNFNDVIDKKVCVKIKESDAKNIKLHENILALLSKFGLVQSDKVTHYNNQSIYDHQVAKPLSKFVKVDVSSYSSTWCRGTVFYLKSDIDKMFTGIKDDNYVLVIDNLKTCSAYIKPNEEFAYPIYRVFQIFNNRRLAEKTKKKNWEIAKFERKMKMTALVFELGLDEYKYQYIEREYEEKNVEKTSHYFIEGRDNISSMYISYSVDEIETRIFTNGNFNTFTMSLEKTKKLLDALHEIGQI